MRIPAFEPFSPELQKRVAVQKAVNQWRKEDWRGPAPKVYCLSNYTMNGIDTFLAYHLMAKRLRPEIQFSGFNVVTQTVIDPTSELYTGGADFVVLSLDLRLFVRDYLAGAWDAPAAAAALHELLVQISERVQKPVLVTDFVLPPGDTRRQGAEGLSNKVALLNSTLADFVAAHSRQFFLLDVNRIVALLGLHESLDNKLWHQTKAPFKSAFLSWLARDIATIIGAHYGLSKKCVILDCDNTLWGGVIGEDGMDGIALDATHYPGVAFYEFQSWLLQLHRQGVLLAICSKNNEADVLEVFAKHPHSLLKREHFACIRANWNNKADNIADIAKTLQLGLNNFVFIDDSHVEVGLVEQAMPELAIIQVPPNPMDLQFIWQAEDLFFIPHRTEEDGRKAAQYQENEARQDAGSNFADMGEFLLSLGTTVEFFVDEASQLERLAQLTQKTNQFNVRTQRYTIQDMEAMLAVPDVVVCSMRVADRFGDLGITNLCIARLDGEGSAFIDTFLMSCRVIKRELENFFFHQCLELLRQRHGVHTVHAEFLRSAKNVLVERLWDDLGLQRLPDGPAGEQRYQAVLAQLAYVQPPHIQLKGASE